MDQKQKPTLKTAQILFWVLAGAVMAPVLILFISYTREDASMRSLIPLIFVTIAGAAIARVVFGFVFFAKSRSQKVLRWILGLLLYAFAIFIAYEVAQLEVFHGVLNR